MKKNLLLLIFLTLFMSLAYAQNKYAVEDKAWACMQKNFAALEIDIVLEQEKYEAFLVEKGFLTAATPAGYMGIYQKIKATNIISPPPVKQDYLELLQLFSKKGNLEPCLSSKERKKTRLYAVQIAAEEKHATVNDLSPSLIADVMLKVYSEEDFKHPFYRFTAIGNMGLLVNKKSGIKPKLPPLPPPPIAGNLAERNYIYIELNRIDEIRIAKDIVPLKQVRKELIPLLRGSELNKDLPERRQLLIEGLGEVPVSKAVISLTAERDATYKVYLALQNEINAAYNQLREEAAQNQFHTSFDKLSDEQESLIRKMVPKRVMDRPYKE